MAVSLALGSKSVNNLSAELKVVENKIGSIQIDIERGITNKNRDGLDAQCKKIDDRI